jgi:hypothetical protein
VRSVSGPSVATVAGGKNALVDAKLAARRVVNGRSGQTLKSPQISLSW